MLWKILIFMFMTLYLFLQSLDFEVIIIFIGKEMQGPKNQQNIPIFGCYTVNNPHQKSNPPTQQPTPKPHPHPIHPFQTHNQLTVTNSLASITQTHRYYNPSSHFLEVLYSVPIMRDCTVHGFEVRYKEGEKEIVIEGVVRERERAEKEYKKGKEEGRKVGIGGVDRCNKGVMNIAVGNIPPETEFTVKISFLQEMRVSASTFYRLELPLQISPRYNNKVSQEQVIIPDYIKKKSQKNYQAQLQCTFNIQLHSSRKVTFYGSPTHTINLAEQAPSKKYFNLGVKCNQDKKQSNFIFLYTTEDFQLPSYIYANNDISSTVMISLIPKFCQMDTNDAYNAVVTDNKNLVGNVNNSKGDYVFLLDRSGSMSGSKINKAKEALILFLKSLPQDSFFNVVSFGSQSLSMFKSSQPNKSAHIQKAIKQISQMKANMGGTEIYKPLQNLLQPQNLVEGYAKHIFLLTDGQISNTEDVINLIKTGVRCCRVYALGIGSEVSIQLLQGCSEAGKGKYALISDDQQPAEKIIQMLQSSLSPLITQISIDIPNREQIQSIIPNPQHIPYILKDQLICFYINYKSLLKDKTKYKFSYKNPVLGLQHKSQITIDPKNQQIQLPKIASTSLSHISKMGRFKILRQLQTSLKCTQSHTPPPSIYLQSPPDTPLKSQIVAYSTTHQLLSEYTAFLCVGRELVDGEWQEFAVRGVDRVGLSLGMERDAVEGRGRGRFVYGFGGGSVNLGSGNVCSKGRGWGGSRNLGIEFASSASDQQQNQEHSIKQNNQALSQKQQQEENQIQLSSSQQFQPDSESEQKPHNKRIIQSIFKFDSHQKQEIIITNNAKPTSKSISQSHSNLNTPKTTPTNSSLLTTIIQQQHPNGSWNSQSLIEQLARNPRKLRQLIKEKNISVEIAVTKLVLLWMGAHYAGRSQYSLIVKKAASWLEREVKRVNFDGDVLGGIQSL